MVAEPGSWHSEVIPAAAERVVQLLAAKDLSSFYLAGGTALALQLGHRISRDFDFFSCETFDEEGLLQRMQDAGVSLVSKAPETLHLQLLDIKVSFLGYRYPVLFPFGSWMSLRVADPRDIACMKISAVAGRGSRRDFVDLYVTARQYGLPHLLELFRQKYAQLDFNLLHALKSLTYFTDAEKEPMPKMLAPIPWQEITDYFREEAPKLI
jgi:hypothetical protein